MKIDLHCHTKAIKKGDSTGRNVTPTLFREKIENADIKIVAITNHNSFDIEQYKILSKAVSGICIVWPGVELDVFEPGSKRWHLIVVVNPKEVECFSKNVDTLFCGKNLDECTHTLDEIYEAFKFQDAIYISHFHQKRPAVPIDDGEKLDRLVGEPHRVFKETANENSMSVFANYRYNVLVGSDVQDWNHYEECTFSELKLPVDSFEQFCLLAKRDENVVQTLLNKKEYRELIAHPASSVDLFLRLYADMNIIFGQKGTGKTEILKSLYESMRASGYKCVMYVASERDEEFKDLLRIGNLSIDIEKMGARECQEEFQFISEWTDSNPTHFSNYINWKKTIGNNANKQRMKITHASSLTRIAEDNEDLHKTDKNTIDDIIRNFRKLGLDEYINEADRHQLIKLIRILKDSIYAHRQNDLVDQQTIHLVNFSINTIKGIADK